MTSACAGRGSRTIDHKCQQRRGRQKNRCVPRGVSRTRGKGVKQMLWEGGWCVDRLSTAASVTPGKNTATILANLPDLKNKKTGLQHCVDSPDPSCCYCQISSHAYDGGDIWHFWGMCELIYRRKINDGVLQHLYQDIISTSRHHCAENRSR